MPKERILVTGGAGFIGRHVCQALVDRGYEVAALDALIDQVHGRFEPLQLASENIVIGDVRDRETVRRALHGVGSVIHLAAEVGVGQSMYDIARYISVNDGGTALLMEELARSPVRRIVVASSMSVYGEGLYRTADNQLVENAERTKAAPGAWDPIGDNGERLDPVATCESKRPSLASVYALTKYSQERLALIVGKAYGMETCALRLFNVFGPGQALSNPYTGVLANFASRILNGKRPLVFEDGLQRRDFVHVADVAGAFVNALERPEANEQVFNIGSGRHYTIRDVATRLAEVMGRPELSPEILMKARSGDVRHCFADIGRARRLLGFEPTRFLETSLDELSRWVKTQSALDRGPDARRELEERGLVA